MTPHLRAETWDAEIWRAVHDADEYGLRQHKGLNYIVDVGAHIGAFSCLAAELFPKAAIMAYEPQPDNYRLLCANLRLVPRPVALCNILSPTAVTDHNGHVYLHGLGEHQNTGGAYLANEGTQVHCVTLRHPLMAMPHIDYLKLDCEGSEAKALAVLTPDELRRIKYIRGEWHGLANRDRVAEILAPTHKVTLLEGAEGDPVWQWLGHFIAEVHR